MASAFPSRRCPPLQLPANARILVRGLNWIGDVVMSTPALLRLREAYPQGHLAVLTRAKLAPLYRHHPFLDQVIVLEKSPLRPAPSLPSFEAALVLPNSFRAAWDVFRGQIPHRLGYPGNGRSFLLTQRIPRPASYRRMHKRSFGEIRRLVRSARPAERFPPNAHQMHHYLHLGRALGASSEPCPPQLAVIPPELNEFRARFKVPTDLPLFGLCPGAEYGTSKRWPPERFVAAAQAIQQAAGGRWILFGTEPSLGEQVALPPGGINLAGRTSLRQLLAGLKLCRLVLTNDSGPMHVAAALGTPVVVPFGSTSPELTGPGLPGNPGHVLLRSEVPCTPCFLRDCPIDHRCMASHSVDALVTAAVRQLMP